MFVNRFSEEILIKFVLSISVWCLVSKNIIELIISMTWMLQG